MPNKKAGGAGPTAPPVKGTSTPASCYYGLMPLFKAGFIFFKSFFFFAASSHRDSS
jgi:hypothetical protein